MADEIINRGDELETKTDTPPEVTKEELEAAGAAGKEGTEAGAGSDKSGEGEPLRDDKGRFIPKAAFDERVGKERAAREAAERRAAELERQVNERARSVSLDALEKEIGALEEKLEDARLDGKKEEALRLSRELRQKERQLVTAESDRLSNEARGAAREEMRMELTIEKMEGQYPMLREGAEEYDQDAVDLVLATQRDLVMREHMSPSRALEAAASKVMGRLMPAASDGGAPAKGLAAGLQSGDRRTEQVAKNIDAANRQPASTRASGLDNDKAGQVKEIPDAGALSFEEFSALPAATKAKMRGDFV
ncbi:MAG: hypothetical protein LBV29_02950 [Azoarcus sp.]|nr:hypothetical protein [Azoarcus sp.]